MKKVLITGADGYLGGRILEYLDQNSDYILKLGILKPDETQCNRHPLYQRHTFCLYDLLDQNTFSDLLSDVDTVIHLAALNHQQCELNPQLAKDINVTAVENLIKSSIDSGVKQFIYFSTFHIYDLEHIKNNQVDENTPAAPKSVYAETHYKAEKHVLDFHNKGQIQGFIFRLSNALGSPVLPHVNAWMLIANDLCRQAVTQRRLILKSSGIQQRNFVPIGDVVRAVKHVINLKTSEPLPLFNLGGNESIRIVDLAKKIQHLSKFILGYQPDLVVPMATKKEKTQQKNFHYSTGKFIATGFEYASSIDEEIKKTLLFCKEHFGEKT